MNSDQQSEVGEMVLLAEGKHGKRQGGESKAFGGPGMLTVRGVRSVKFGGKSGIGVRDLSHLQN